MIPAAEARAAIAGYMKADRGDSALPSNASSAMCRAMILSRPSAAIAADAPMLNFTLPTKTPYSVADVGQ